MNSKSKVDFSMIKNNDFLICLHINNDIYNICYILYKHIRKSLFLIMEKSILIFKFIIHIYWNISL